VKGRGRSKRPGTSFGSQGVELIGPAARWSHTRKSGGGGKKMAIRQEEVAGCFAEERCGARWQGGVETMILAWGTATRGGKKRATLSTGVGTTTVAAKKKSRRKRTEQKSTLVKKQNGQAWPNKVHQQRLRGRPPNGPRGLNTRGKQKSFIQGKTEVKKKI